MIKKRYQLIKPIISNNIYETSSFNRASKRCYEEVIRLKISNLQTFTMRNIDTNDIYEFKIKSIPSTQSTQSTQSIVGNNLLKQNIQNNVNNNFNALENADDIENINNLINLNFSSQSIQNQPIVQQNQNINNENIKPTDQLVNKKIEVIVSEIKNICSRLSRIENHLKNEN